MQSAVRCVRCEPWAAIATGAGAAGCTRVGTIFYPTLPHCPSG